MNLTRVDELSDADVTINDCTYDCTERYEMLSGKSAYNLKGVVFGRENKVYIGYNYQSGEKTLQHEFSHYLGLKHQANAEGNAVGSIRSYSESREILAIDRQHLYSGYVRAFNNIK